MSQLFNNGNVTNISNEMALRYLAARLPDDTAIISQVAVPSEPLMPAIDVVLITRNGLFVAALRDWQGEVAAGEDIRQVYVGAQSRPYANPLLLVREQARVLRDYLFVPEQAQTVFTDVRIAGSLAIHPLVLFSHPDVEPALPDMAGVHVAPLGRIAALLAELSGDRPASFLATEERQRLVRLLAHPGVLPPIAAGDEYLDTASPPSRRRVPQPDREPAEPQFFHFVAEPRTEQQSAHVARTARPNLADYVSVLPAWAESQAQGLERHLIGQGRKPITAGRIASELEKQLENKLNHLLQMTVAHNAYTVALAPEDYAAYLPIKEQLEADLSQYLQQVITSRDYTLRGALVVEVVESTALATGDCLATSCVLGEAVAVAGRAPYVELAGNGRRFPLARASVTIGRARENDICLGELDKERIISRFHAAIRREEGGYVLYDQGSSRGTYVAGRRLKENGHRLQDGDSFVLGPTQRVNGDRPLQGSVMFIFRAG